MAGEERATRKLRGGRPDADSAPSSETCQDQKHGACVTPMEFDQVVFYGRLGHHALAMFNLDPADWRGAKVLDCPGGPGSLSAELRAHKVDVTAVDPLYALGAAELEQRAKADLETALAAMASTNNIRPDFDLAACRREHLEALEAFLGDRQKHPDRYVAASLPQLPFADHSFDLVVCGHLLFSYAPVSAGGLMPEPGMDLAWHRLALGELQRVSRRWLRLYPAHTIERQARRHPYAETLLAELSAGWQGRFIATTYDQGHEGCTDGLELERTANTAKSNLPTVLTITPTVADRLSQGAAQDQGSHNVQFRAADRTIQAC